MKNYLRHKKFSGVPFILSSNSEISTNTVKNSIIKQRTVTVTQPGLNPVLNYSPGIQNVVYLTKNTINNTNVTITTINKNNYITFQFDDSFNSLTECLSIYIPSSSSDIYYSKTGYYQNGITQFFGKNDSIIIQNTDFPVPVIIYDFTGVKVTISDCSFSNSRYATGLETNTNLEYGLQQGFLLNCNSINQKYIGFYNLQGTNTFNLPNATLLTPIITGPTSEIFNYGNCIINVNFDTPDTNISIYQLENNPWHGLNNPVINFSGSSGTFAIEGDMGTSASFINTGANVVTIRDVSFESGLTLDLTNGSGFINFDNCQFYPSSNGYAISSTGNNTKVEFTGNTSILWTNKNLNVTPWYCSNSLDDIIRSEGNIALILSSGSYSFDILPVSLQNGNIYLSDSLGTYSFSNINGNVTFIPFTSDTSVYKSIVSSAESYYKLFGSSITTIQSVITIDNVHSNSNVIINTINTDIVITDTILSKNISLITEGNGTITANSIVSNNDIVINSASGNIIVLNQLIANLNVNINNFGGAYLDLYQIISSNGFISIISEGGGLNIVEDIVSGTSLSVIMEGNFNIEGNITASDNVLLYFPNTSFLTVNDITSIFGNINVNGTCNITINNLYSDFDISITSFAESTNILGSINSIGNVTLSNDMIHTQDITTTENLFISGNTVVSGNLHADSIKVLSTGTITTDYISSQGAVDLNSNLSVQISDIISIANSVVINSQENININENASAFKSVILSGNNITIGGSVSSTDDSINIIAFDEYITVSGNITGERSIFLLGNVQITGNIKSKNGNITVNDAGSVFGSMNAVDFIKINGNFTLHNDITSSNVILYGSITSFKDIFSNTTTITQLYGNNIIGGNINVINNAILTVSSGKLNTGNILITDGNLRIIVNDDSCATILYSEGNSIIATSNGVLNIESFNLVGNGNTPYLFDTTGNGVTNLYLDSSYKMYVINEKNFFNYLGNNLVIDEGLQIEFSMENGIYNFSSGIEYSGNGSIYSNGINCIGNDYTLTTSDILSLFLTSNTNISESNIVGGLGLLSGYENTLLTISDSNIFSQGEVSSSILYNEFENTVQYWFEPRVEYGNAQYQFFSNSVTSTSFDFRYYEGEVFTLYDSDKKYYAPWVQISYIHPIIPHGVELNSYTSEGGTFPVKFIILGSTNGINWTSLAEGGSTDNTIGSEGNLNTIASWSNINDIYTWSSNITTDTSFKYFRYCINSINNAPDNIINLFGLTIKSDYPSLLTVYDSNVSIDIVNNDNFYLMSNYFICSNIEYITNTDILSGSVNLIDNGTFVSDDYPKTREIERKSGIHLITLNGNYELSGISANVTEPLKMWVDESNITISNSLFSNEIKIMTIADTLTIENSNLESGTNAVIDLNNVFGDLIIYNSLLNINDGTQHFFINYSNSSTTSNLNTFNIGPSKDIYDINVEPIIVDKLNLVSEGSFTIGEQNNPLNRNLLLTSTGTQNLNIEATVNQKININNDLTLNGNISANSDNVLSVFGTGQLIVESLILNQTNINGNIITTSIPLISTANGMIFNGSYNIPIVSYIDFGSGEINIENTDFSGATYPYVYWPNLGNSSASVPFSSSLNFVATSWLPSKNVYSFLKTDALTWELTSDSLWSDPSSNINPFYEYNFYVAPGNADILNVTLSFHGPNELLPGINDEELNSLFSSKVSDGNLGMLASSNISGEKYLTFTERKNHFKFILNNDNSYIGNLFGNINLSGSCHYPNDFVYNLYESNTIPQLSITAEGVNFISSQVYESNIDVYNDTNIVYKYIVTSNLGLRPIVLDNKIYLRNTDGTAITTDVRATYDRTTPTTASGFQLEGSSLTISNIIGIELDAPWWLEFDFSNVATSFNLVTIGDELSISVIDGNIVADGLNIEVPLNSFHPIIGYQDGNIFVYGNALVNTFQSDAINGANIISMNKIVFGNNVTELSNVRISNYFNPGEYKDTVYFNSMISDNGLTLIETEQGIFNSSLISKLVVSTNDLSYAYLRPNIEFSNSGNNIIIKSDNITILPWNTANICVGVSYSPSVIIEQTSLCLLKINNMIPNNLHPLVQFNYPLLPSWPMSTDNLFIFDPNVDPFISLASSRGYIEEFYLSIKMANLKYFSGNIFIYNDPTNTDIEFNFYDINNHSLNVTTYNVPNLNIQGALVTFNRINNHFNENNIKSFYVKGTGNKILPQNQTIYGNIIISPYYDNYSSNLLPLTESIAEYKFIVPTSVRLAVSDSNSFPVDANLFISEDMTVSNYISKTKPVYLFVESLSIMSSPLNVSLNLLNNYLPIAVTPPDVQLNFEILPGEYQSSNVYSIIATSDNKIWGNSSITLMNSSTGNTMLPNIIIPYEELDTRALNFYFMDYLNDVVSCSTFTDEISPSTQLQTTTFNLEGTITSKTDILSKEFRQGLSLTTSSIPHSNDGTEETLTGSLEFYLGNSSVSKIFNVTNLVNIFDITGDSLSNITLDNTEFGDPYSNTVYLDFSNVSINSENCVISVYATFTSDNDIDYSGFLNEKVEIATFNFSNSNLQNSPGFDNILVGNWRIITGPDSKLLFEYKRFVGDSWHVHTSFPLTD